MNSCSESDETNANTTQSSAKSENTASRRMNECPEGQMEQWSYAFSGFNFHRPVMNCESGFWFCQTGGHWVVKCVTRISTPTLINNVATVYGSEVDGKAELRFPIGIKNLEGYTEEDLQNFNVDENYEIVEGVTLKQGVYPVTETAQELVVLVDIL